MVERLCGEMPFFLVGAEFFNITLKGAGKMMIDITSPTFCKVVYNLRCPLFPVLVAWLKWRVFRCCHVILLVTIVCLVTGGARQFIQSSVVVSNLFLFSTRLREMIQFDENFFRWVAQPPLREPFFLGPITSSLPPPSGPVEQNTDWGWLGLLKSIGDTYGNDWLTYTPPPKIKAIL